MTLRFADNTVSICYDASMVFNAAIGSVEKTGGVASSRTANAFPHGTALVAFLP
jgi:hypothetical protein